MRSTGRLSALVAGWGMLLTALLGNAAAPALEHLYPAGAQRGTTNLITAIGKQDTWPVEVWTDDDEIHFKAEKDKGKFTVTVSPKARQGPHLIRLYNAEGASAVRFFLVGDVLEAEEKEANDDFSKAQSLEKLPVIVNGRLEKNGDLDSYAITLQEGQWLVASLDAYVLSSTMDGLLRITDTNGLQMAFNHDSNLTLDPFLAWQASKSGTYIVQVMGFAYPATSSIQFDGGTGNIYRLGLTTGAYLHHTFPTGITRTNAEVEVYGWNLAGGKQSAKVRLKPETLAAGSQVMPVSLESLNTLEVPVGSSPEQVEQEPNDSRAEAGLLVVPGQVSGRIQQTGDVDCFTFESKKGQKWELAVLSDKLGFPLDATLRIEDATGKELAKNDDANSSSDPYLLWTAPAEGKFTVVISSLLRQAGSNYIYRLVITEPQPDFKVTVTANSFNVSPGKTNEFKATVKKLHGHDRSLTLEAVGLPKGISLSAVEIPAKGGEVTLKLVAQADARPASGEFSLVVKDTATGKTDKISHELVSRGVDNGVPQGYSTLVIERVERFWLTVR